MFFHYSALNPDNKRLSGVIEAENQASAEQKLNELGYSIVDLKGIIGELPVTPGMARFLFTAIDKKNNKVNGTIEAKTLEEAFRKLSEEYDLDIENVFMKDATPEEKEKSIALIAGLKQFIKKISGTQEKGVVEEQEKERQELLKLVERTMQTVQNFMKQNENDMKADERDTIHSYLDQLARIKDSTNLDHIRKTSENLLKHIREKEIFLAERKREQMEMQMKVEAKTLLFDIQHTGLQTEIDVLSLAERLSRVKFIGSIGTFVLRLYGADDPEIREKYRVLKKLRKKLFELFRLGYMQGNEIIRNEARAEISRILAQRKRLKIELAALKTKRKLELGENVSAPAFSGLTLFLGWLLAIYLAFHFFTFPFVFYKTEFETLPKSFFVFLSPLTLGLMGLLFLLHATVTLKKLFLPNHILFSLLLFPVSAILYLFFLFNFVI